MNACLQRVALPFPGGHFLRDPLLALQPTAQALAVHDADRRFGHVQPTPMLGRVVPFNLVQYPAGLRGRGRFVQAGPVVGVQVVRHQPNLLGLGVMHVHQLPHAPGVIPPRPPRAHPDVPPAAQGLTHHQLMADALALVLLVLPRGAAGLGRQRRPHLPEPLLAGFVETDDGVQRVVRPQVGLDHVFQPPDLLGVRPRRDAPRLDNPGLDGVFFSARRTVSVETVRTNPKATSSSASRAKVQWQRPSGGPLHARWINCCSMSPRILTLSGRGGWGLGWRAASSPSVTRRWRTRSTVRRLVSRAATIASSEHPWPWEVSASRRMRAWVSLRAAPLPTEIVCSNCMRSSAVSVTRYLAIMDLLFLKGGMIECCG